jgi:hypothetical protein
LVDICKGLQVLQESAVIKQLLGGADRLCLLSSTGYREWYRGFK